MVRRARSLIVAAMASGATWYACSIYDSSLIVAAEGGIDAQIEATVDAAMDAGCTKAAPPARPAKDDPGGSDVDIVFAVRAFTYDAPDGGTAPLIGYDVDGLCTCPDPEACVAVQKGQTHCDDSNGRDNGGAALLRLFESLSGGGLFSQSVIDDGLDAGTYGMLVRVRNYNGLANDTAVEISSYIADGVTTATAV